MGNIILVPTVGGFVFFLIFIPRNLGESMIQFDCQAHIFDRWVVKKTTNGKMRFGSVPYKNQNPTGSDGGIFKSSTICWAAREGRRNVQLEGELSRSQGVQHVNF